MTLIKRRTGGFFNATTSMTHVPCEDSRELHYLEESLYEDQAGINYCPRLCYSIPSLLLVLIACALNLDLGRSLDSRGSEGTTEGFHTEHRPASGSCRRTRSPHHLSFRSRECLYVPMFCCQAKPPFKQIVRPSLILLILLIRNPSVGI